MNETTSHALRVVALFAMIAAIGISAAQCETARTEADTRLKIEKLRMGKCPGKP